MFESFLINKLKGILKPIECAKLVAGLAGIKAIYTNKEFYSYKDKKDWEEVCDSKGAMKDALNSAFERFGVQLFDDAKTILDILSELQYQNIKPVVGNIISAQRDSYHNFCYRMISLFGQNKKYAAYDFQPYILDIPLTMFKIKPNSSVVNYYSGMATLLMHLYNYSWETEEPHLYFGQESNPDVYAVAQFISFILLGSYEKMALDDSIMQPVFIENGELKKFDFAISIPPFSQPEIDLDKLREDKYLRFPYGIPQRSIGNNEWVIAQHLVASLKDKGKAAVLLPMGALFRGGSEADIRKKFIEDDLIDAVIKLPGKMFPHTAIETCWIIFDKEKKKERKFQIEFINYPSDLSSTSQVTKVLQLSSSKLNSITWNDIRNSAEKVILSKTEIEKHEYNLNAFDYLELDKLYGELNYCKMIKLSEVGEIKRGVQLTKNKANSVMAVPDGEYFLLSLGNINKDGVIQLDENKKIKAEKRWIENYQAQKGDLLITSKGSLFKVALVDDTIDNAIVTSNLFIIRLNSKKYKPEIFKYFLNSKIGMEIVEKLYKGSIIGSISNKDLENLLIPNIPIEEQEPLLKMILESESRYTSAILKAQKELQIQQNEIDIKMGINNK